MGLNDRNYMREKPVFVRDINSGRRMLFILLFLNIAVFMLEASAVGTMNVTGYFVNPVVEALILSKEGILNLELYRLITSAFLHADIYHILFNMWGLYLFGTLVAPHIGGWRFLGLYVIGALCGDLLFLAIYWNEPFRLLGASGAVFAVMVGAALFEPNRRFVMFIAPMFPIKTTTLVVCYTIAELVLQFSSGRESGVAHLAHLGGALGGYLMLRLLYGARLPWDPLRKRSRRGATVTFTNRFNESPDITVKAGDNPVTSRELDRILDKISKNGINSLSEEELARLRKAREQMRGGEQ